MQRRAPRAVGSLFDRTLADAERMQGVRENSVRENGATPAIAPRDAALNVAGLRARSGYLQAAPEDDAIAREERISELQRAIVAARRNAG